MDEDRVYAVRIEGDMMVTDSMLAVLGGSTLEERFRRLERLFDGVLPILDPKVKGMTLLSEDDPRTKGVRDAQRVEAAAEAALRSGIVH